MAPVLFQFHGITVFAHGFFLFLSMLVCVLVVVLESRRRHWPKEEVIPIALAAFVGGMLGARLSILFFNGLGTAPLVLNFFEMFDPHVGPGSIIGGVIGAYIAGYLASRLIGKQGCACDAFAPAMALATAVGRVGCYLAGEDGLGKPTTLPWGVQLPGSDYLVHPTPLYDMGFNLVWFAILLALRNHPRMQDGNLLKFGIVGYAFFRFFVEFVRNNQVLWLGLTGQQFACLAILAAVLVYYARKLPQLRSLRPSF
jgi:phosphatidylglycerol---prolipoprotein diacylglyceryl transferase